MLLKSTNFDSKYFEVVNGLCLKISNAIAFGVNEYVLKKDDKSMKGYVDQIAGYICSSLAYPFQVIQF